MEHGEAGEGVLRGGIGWWGEGAVVEGYLAFHKQLGV
jgi:hypothetical protein